MDKLAYCGHPYQLFGVEEQRLVNARADGMRALEVKNGRGLQFTILLDRGCGIARLSYKGTNCSFLSSSGLRTPQYYVTEVNARGFLRNFHAGFLTTCGVFNVGVPCIDDGEQTILHGDLDNTPCESHHSYVADGKLHIECLIRVEEMFYHKVTLKRHFIVGLEEDTLRIEDEFENTGSTKCPMMVLYHMNMGYPLLDEDSQLFINSQEYRPRTELAKQDAANWNKITAPEHNYEERCYYHSFDKSKESVAAIYQPKADIGLAIKFDHKNLPFFVEWKQMGYRDYALGLEPGNSHCDGRDKMRASGDLQFLTPGEKANFHVEVNLFAGAQAFEQIKKDHQVTADNVPALVV